MFKLEFDTGNAAFDDGDRNREVARILHNLGRQLEELSPVHEIGGTVHDANGNRVGSWTLE